MGSLYTDLSYKPGLRGNWNWSLICSVPPVRWLTFLPAHSCGQMVKLSRLEQMQADVKICKVGNTGNKCRFKQPAWSFPTSCTLGERGRERKSTQRSAVADCAEDKDWTEGSGLTEQGWPSAILILSEQTCWMIEP